MCEPITIATALAVATTAFTVYSEDQKVDAQNKFNKQTAQEGSRLANESFITQAGLARERDAQNTEAASQDLTESAKKAAQARATERVSAGEAGVAGVSVDALINDFYRQEGTYSDSVAHNNELSSAQTGAELLGFRSTALDRSLSLRRPNEARPSYLAAGLTAGGQVANGYMRYRYPSGG